MTKAELENMIKERNIMDMEQCRHELSNLGKFKSSEEIIRIIVSNEIVRINKELGEDHAYELNETTSILKNFSLATAARQKEHLREGKRVLGPHPMSLKKNVKTYYPQLEVAATMYLQSHPVTSYMQPSLSKLLETRHD